QFGVMGNIYMNNIFEMKNPRVGLINIGTEKTKGTELQKEAYELMEKAPYNFIGNAEARDIPLGCCDVAVCDGWTGNIVLKTTEGLAKSLMGGIKGIFKKNVITKAAAAMVMGGLRDFKKQMDYTEHGGAPLMGISKPVIKAHGSSNAKAFKNAIRQAEKFVSQKVIEKIEDDLNKL
ncbi:MAG: phosphate--acyl-ACP acyltransferase, partial [Oscillospiraceae bacterium]